MSVLWLGDWCLKATLLLLICGVAASVARNQPSLRRLIWAVGFCSVLFLPALTWLTRPQLSLVEVQIPADLSAAPATGTSWAGFWLAGAAIVIANHAAGLVALARLKKRSVRLPDLSEDCDVRMSLSESPHVALTWGLMRPVILLPLGADTWEPSRLEAVMLHELAHVQRRDSLFILLTTLTCAVLWFNPIVWLCAGIFRFDSEAAADEAVLKAGIRPTDYATALLAAAGAARVRQVSAGIAFARQPQIEKRIRWIVSTPATPRGATRRHTLLVLTVAFVLTASLCVVTSSGASPEDKQRSKEWLEGYAAGQAFYKYYGSVPPKPPALTLFLSDKDKRNLELWLAKNKRKPHR